MRQKELRSAAAERKENIPEGRSKRERKKRKDDDEKSVKSEKRDFFSTFSLRSKRERKRKKKGRMIESKSKREKKKITEKKLTEEKSIRTKKKKLRDFPVTDEQKDNYFNFLMEMFDLGVEGILKQYQTNLKAYIPPNISHTAFDKNFKKNRYKDVICIDETRVILQEGQCDYIHANHVKGDPFLNAFICTQGPMSVTVNDFWIMIMQEKVSNIVMLCNIIESGKNKCFQYWPQEVGSSLTFGDVQVRCAEVNENKDTTFVLSILEAENKNIRLNIKHLRWKDWPDKGVPSSVLAPFRILKIVRQSLDRATVVHCSAGIGRTGCMVAIEMSLQQILSGKPLSIIDMVKRLRSMRMSAIQTDEQFVYVVRCLIAYADACGLLNSKPELQEKAEKFADDYTAMLAAKKTITPVEQKILPEAEPVEGPATAKVEERQEEPSQKSIQDAFEPDETALRLNLLKMALKQAQPLQMLEDQKRLQKIRSEPVLLPSATAIEQPQKVAELVPSLSSASPLQKPKKAGEPAPLLTTTSVQKPKEVAKPIPLLSAATPPQKLQKADEPVPLSSATPGQKPQKAAEPVPLPSVTPLQKPQKAAELVPSSSATPGQKPQKAAETVPLPSVTPPQKPQKAAEPVPSSSATPGQKPQKAAEPVPLPSVTPPQKPQKADEPVPSPSAIPNKKPQKAIKLVLSPSVTPIQQLGKSAQLVSSPSVKQKPIEPISSAHQQSQGTTKMVSSPSASPLQQPKKQIQSVPSPSIAPVRKSQEQASAIMKTDWKLSQKQPLTAQQRQQSQNVQSSQQPGNLRHIVERKLNQSALPLESADSKKLLPKPLSPVASPGASQLKPAQLKPIPVIITQSKAPNNDPSNTKR